MRNSIYRQTYRYENGEVETTEFEFWSANRDIYAAYGNESLGVEVVEYGTWKKKVLVAFEIVEPEQQPEVKGVATSVRGIL